jgi:copper chaperone CopZ
MSETTLVIAGMTCRDCASHVEPALASISGVRILRGSPGILPQLAE